MQPPWIKKGIMPCNKKKGMRIIIGEQIVKYIIHNSDYFLADRKMSILAEIRVYLLDLFDYIR